MELNGHGLLDFFFFLGGGGWGEYLGGAGLNLSRLS